MIAFALLALAILLGCAALAHLYGTLPGPRWAQIVFLSGAGAAFGLGLTSVIFTVSEQVIWWWSYPGLGLECALLVALVLQFWRKYEDGMGLSAPRASFTILPAAALMVALILATTAIVNGWDSLPQGNWDAWSIWNLRAKFLATPTLAARAWSPMLANTHPEYPLLLSGAIGRCWNAAHEMPNSVPMAIGCVFFLSLIAIVTGGVAIARGATAGLIAGLALACSSSLVLEVSSQYSDVPIAAYFAGAMILLLLDRPIWAGAFAAFAAWTKDEGAMFCAIFVVLIAMIRRDVILRVLLGMLPAGIIYAGFKLFFAPHVSVMFGPGSGARFADGARWETILGGIGGQFLTLGAGWIHPILILAALAIAVRIRLDSKREALLPTLTAAALLAAYTAAMVTAPNEAQWQASTAAGRLIVQWWPLAVIAIIFWLRPAEELAVAAEARQAKPREARQKKVRR